METEALPRFPVRVHHLSCPLDFFRTTFLSISIMKPNILTREKLAIIETSIEQNGGATTARRIARNHGISCEVIHEAIERGFISSKRNKGQRGRPSVSLSKVSKNYPTKLPPTRSSLENLISPRQWRFARNYAVSVLGKFFFDAPKTDWTIYIISYDRAKSSAGARASASRLLKKPEVIAAISWTLAKELKHLEACESEPQTISEIWTILLSSSSRPDLWAPLALTSESAEFGRRE